MNKLLALALSLTLALPASAQQATDPGYPTYAAPTFPLANLMPYTPGVANSLRPNDKIVFIGDSITVLGTSAPDGWINQFTQIAQTCGVPNVSVTSFGVNGIGTVGMAQTYFNSTVLPLHATILVIWLGINDVQGLQYGQSGTTPFSYTAGAIGAMIQAALTTGTREVVLVSPMCRGELLEDQNYWDNDINWLSYYYMTWAQANVIADPAGQCVLTYIPMREEWRQAEWVTNVPRQATGVFADPVYGLHPTDPEGEGFVANVMLKAFGLPQITGNIQAP